jgi:V8-like Glu-specific endopeptidase
MTHLIQGRKLFILPMAERSPTPFEEIFAVEDLNTAKQAFEITQVFHDAVDSNGHFSLPKATQIAKQHPNMAVVRSMYETLSQNDNRVEDMVNQVIFRLNDFLDIAVPQKQQEQLNAAISYAFTSLNTQTKDGWIFYRQESGHSTTYQYNILFAVQNPSTGGFVYAVAMGMTIKVDREYERVLFITLKDQVSYSVQIEALKVMEPLESYVNACALTYLHSGVETLGDASNRQTVQAVFPETNHLRTQVQNTRVFPYNTIGRIRTDWGNGVVGWGTGFVVELNGGTFVLTVAHNFWERRSRKAAKSATFSLGMNSIGGDPVSIGLYNVKEWKFPEEYKSSSDNNSFLYDYALVKLDDDSLDSVLPLRFDSEITKRDMCVVGYPGDKSPACDQMWNAPGQLKNENLIDPLLFYNASTYGGNSGSPVLGYISGENDLYVIGIHSNYFPWHNINAGRRLDDEVEVQLLKWSHF